MIIIILAPVPRALAGQEFTNHKKITVGKTRRLRQTTSRPNYRMTFYKVQRKGHMFLYILTFPTLPIAFPSTRLLLLVSYSLLTTKQHPGVSAHSRMNVKSLYKLASLTFM